MKIGIDLGGSHVAVGLINDDLELIEKIEENLSKEEKQNLSYALIANIENKITQILEQTHIGIEQIEQIGIACPGTIKEGHIYKASNLGLKDFPMQEKLQEIFPSTLIKIRNDAKCAALAEMKKGSLKGYQDAVFLGLGTGIGGAVFLKGQLLESTHFSAFEIGHMIIEKDGLQCTCGKKGCFEKYGSMKALKDTIRSKYGLGEDVHSRELMEILSNGSKKSEKILEEYLEMLKIGIGNLIDLFEPEIICFGGSFAYYEELFMPRLKEKLKEPKLTFNERTDIKLTVATLQNNAGIIGAIC